MNWTDLLISFFMLIGGFFMLAGSIGLVRLPDLFMRMHAPTKATTMGVGNLLLASIIFFSTKTDSLHLGEVLITLFLFVTAPVSAYMMSRSALHLKIPAVKYSQFRHLRAASADRSNNPDGYLPANATATKHKKPQQEPAATSPVISPSKN